MSYYFIAPVLILLVRKRISYGLMALVLLFLLLWGVGLSWHYINKNPQGFFAPITFLLNGTFAGQSLLFFAGLALASWIREKGDLDLLKLPYKTASGLLGISAVIATMVFLQQDLYDQGNHHTGGIILQLTLLHAFVALLLAGLMYERTWLQIFLSSRVMVVLGNASFSFYLIHISYVNLKLKSKFLLPDRNFILMWLMSIALYYFFEKPIYALVRKCTKG
jgi:peptidoglycan/LPS O-acetylase OafA/YrhL